VSSLEPAPRGPCVVPAYAAADALDLSLILPTFQEASNIQAMLHVVSQTLRSLDGLRFEIIVVDDNSADGTAQLALEESAELPEVRVIRRTEEAGLATAVVRGWQASRGRILAVMDADLQHPPDTLRQLVQAMRSGVDLAVASRHVEEGGVSDWSLPRRIVSRTAQLLGLTILPEVVGRVSDPMSGYFMLQRGLIAGKRLDPTGYKILIEVIARGALQRVSEIGYVFRERREGRSKATLSIYLQYVQHLLRLRIALLRESRFVRFCLVGSTGVAVDMLILFLLSDPRMLALGLTRSKIVAAEAAIANNFLWNDAWTFADLIGAQDSLRRKFHRFLKFNAICLMGLVLSVALLNLQFNWLGMNRYVANAIAILASTFWNYQVNRSMGWRSSN
jgi:dolichol-phosphate mannosyltransferase